VEYLGHHNSRIRLTDSRSIKKLQTSTVAAETVTNFIDQL